MFVCLLLLVSSSAWAVLVDFNFRYPVLELKNGKILKNAVLTTYETSTGRVAARADGGLSSIRIADLPNDVVARINERVPKQTEDEIKAEKQRIADDHIEAKRRASELEKQRLEEVKANRNDKRKLDVKKAEAAVVKADATEEDIAKEAKALASYYFEYEADKHAPVGWVFDTKVMLEDPEPVPGWTNRWRVNGKIGTKSLSQTGGSFERRSREFEMLIEAQEKGKPKLIDVTLK